MTTLSKHGSPILVLLVLLCLPLLFACGERSEDASKGSATQSKADPGAAPLPKETMTVTLHIDGMTCEHCVNTVTRVLSGCEGVASVEVSLEESKAVVKGDKLNVAALSKVVQEASYKVTGVDG